MNFDKLILKHLTSGNKDLNDISFKTGASISTIIEVAENNNIKVNKPKKKDKRRKKPKNYKKLILSELEKGKDVKSICVLYTVSSSTVYKIANDNNINLRNLKNNGSQVYKISKSDFIRSVLIERNNRPVTVLELLELYLERCADDVELYKKKYYERNGVYLSELDLKNNLKSSIAGAHTNVMGVFNYKNQVYSLKDFEANTNIKEEEIIDKVEKDKKPEKVTMESLIKAGFSKEKAEKIIQIDNLNLSDDVINKLELERKDKLKKIVFDEIERNLNLSDHYCEFKELKHIHGLYRNTLMSILIMDLELSQKEIDDELDRRKHKHVSKKNSASISTKGKKRTYIKNKEQWFQRANEVHDNKYSYDNVVYEKSNTKVSITCPLHGDFLQQASNHLQGNGCPKCHSEKREQNRLKRIREGLPKYEDTNINITVDGNVINIKNHEKYNYIEVRDSNGGLVNDKELDEKETELKIEVPVYDTYKILLASYDGKKHEAQVEVV